MKDKLLYLLKWMIYQGYMMVPGCYMICLLAFNWNFNLRYALLTIILGVFIRYGYIGLKSRELDDDGIDFDFISEEYANTRDKSFSEYLRDMPYWERMHWVPVIIFLLLTCYVMIRGLQLLFVLSTPTDIFIYIFSGVVTYTLFWLVLMISNRKKMWGFFLFYLLFDLMSAFSFNFVHFYDNVSQTQRRDADMKACRMYQDIQEKNVDHITNMAMLEKLKSEMEVRENTAKIEDIESEINKLERKINSNYYYGRSEDKRQLKELKSQRFSLKAADINPETSLQAYSHILDSLGGKLRELCIKYEDNSSNVSNAEVQEAKDFVRRMQDVVEELGRTGKLDSSFVIRNDTITYITRKIEAKGSDHFASLKSLFGAVFVDKEKETQLREEYCTGGGRALERFYDEEKSFENRLLYLSIALSSLIDLLPLFLGLFVSFAKGKEK